MESSSLNLCARKWGCKQQRCCLSTTHPNFDFFLVCREIQCVCASLHRSTIERLDSTCSCSAIQMESIVSVLQIFAYVKYHFFTIYITWLTRSTLIVSMYNTHIFDVHHMICTRMSWCYVLCASLVTYMQWKSIINSKLVGLVSTLLKVHCFDLDKRVEECS